MPKGISQARSVLRCGLPKALGTRTMRILAPVGCYKRQQRSLRVTLSRLVHVAGRQAVRLWGPAATTEGTGPPRAYAENLGAQVWGTTSTKTSRLDHSL